ncbi:MAG TPA: hypothetical protein VJ375_08880, partial [Gaiellaceae bacterium]|nr:hypothetical protein [Gaiellaceae bacterium]
MPRRPGQSSPPDRRSRRQWRHVQAAIESEHEAAHLVGSEPATARLQLSISALALSAAFDLLEPTAA